MVLTFLTLLSFFSLDPHRALSLAETSTAAVFNRHTTIVDGLFVFCCWAFYCFYLLAAWHTCRRTYVLPVLFFCPSFFSPCILGAHWMELNQNRPLVRSGCNLKMHVRNLGYPLPLQIGRPKTTFFPRLRNLTTTLTAYIFGTKPDIYNRVSAMITTRGVLYHFKMLWTLVHKRLQTGPLFLPTLCEFCFLLHCQASQTDISKWNSSKLCQTVYSKSC